MDYQFKSVPFDHQTEIFDRTKDTPSYGLFWEQGCGKTKPTIDTSAYLFGKGEIDGLFVVAPNGVHRNWVTDEIPVHMPDGADASSMFWQTGKHTKSEYKNRMQNLLKHKGLAVLTMSYDAFLTASGKEYAGKFMRQRRCLMGVDESQGIKSWDAMRTRTCLTAAKFARYRRALSGTPISTSPFDIFTQIKFLDENFWKDHGISSFGGFKHTFGIWEKRTITTARGAHQFDQLVKYKNLEKLNEMIGKISHRLTKEDAKLNLPEKLYSKRYVELSDEQAKAYRDLKTNLYTMIGNNLIEAPLAITQLIRFQQVVCGYATDIDGNVIKVVEPKKNPRLKALREILEETQTQGIIWARFTTDIDQITSMMDEMGISYVRYDGQVGGDERAINKQAFQDGEKQWFVGNQAAGATGLTLVQAKVVVYYSNSFRLVDRLQSEDRAHRIGQQDPVLYIDLVTPDTVDEHIVRALREKRDIASTVLGDNIKDWI